MDLDEWELLPIDGLLDFSDGYDKKVSQSKRRSNDSTAVFHLDLDYFRCPSPTSRLSPPSHLVPVRIQLDPPPIKKDPGDEREMMEEIAAPNMEEAADKDTVSQVFFKKMKENEFVDMKILESPRSGSRPVSPPIENCCFGNEPKTLESPQSPRREPERNGAADREIDGEEANGGGLNIWKWSLTGIGAVCSFGVAAATVCAILIMGSHQRNRQSHQKIRFQIYTDDKVSDFSPLSAKHLIPCASS